MTSMQSPQMILLIIPIFNSGWILSGGASSPLFFFLRLWLSAFASPSREKVDPVAGQGYGR